MNEIIKFWDEERVRSHIKPARVIKFFKDNGLRNINFIDIGANVGKYYDVLSEEIGVNKCEMIEPCDELVEYLKEKYKNNNSVKICDKAITEQNGFFHFSNITQLVLKNNNDKNNIKKGFNLGTSSIGNRPGDKEGITFTNFLNNINTIPFKNIHFIKIDTENLDIKILSNLTEFIEQKKISPFISFEKNYGKLFSHKQAQEIIDKLCRVGKYEKIDIESSNSDVDLIPIQLS